jgi:hypothetical protein
VSGIHKPGVTRAIHLRVHRRPKDAGVLGGAAPESGAPVLEAHGMATLNWVKRSRFDDEGSGRCLVGGRAWWRAAVAACARGVCSDGIRRGVFNDGYTGGRAAPRSAQAIAIHRATAGGCRCHITTGRTRCSARAANLRHLWGAGRLPSPLQTLTVGHAARDVHAQLRCGATPTQLAAQSLRTAPRTACAQDDGCRSERDPRPRHDQHVAPTHPESC